MAIKLHRCGGTFMKFEGHACWRVQKALDEHGIEYELVKEPSMPRSRRKTTIERTGQERLPWIEFDDGSVYRDESKAMAETIRAGRLDEKRGAGAAAAT